MTPLQGSCHCGPVAYQVDEEPPTGVMECNCSLCRRRVALHHFTMRDRVALRTSRVDLDTYR